MCRSATLDTNIIQLPISACVHAGVKDSQCTETSTSGWLCYSITLPSCQHWMTPIIGKTVALYTSFSVVQVRRWLIQEWKSKSRDFQQYMNSKEELSVQLGCVLWVLLARCRDALLEVLCVDHPIISRMKSFVQCHIWSPIIYSDIELYVRSCYVPK